MRICLLLLFSVLTLQIAAADDLHDEQFGEIQSVMRRLCLDCHNSKTKEGELDLQRFTSIKQVRADLEPWQAMTLQLESLEMPPKDQPQPTDIERQKLIVWTNKLLRLEAIARAGDPGFVPLHRLSNTEYDNTIRDLTGFDLKPTKTFPAEGAAGEGFTNAAEALSMSPAMMTKYIKAAKQLSQHAVLLPDGFRFFQSATQRDQTDESLAELRKFYRQYSYEGSLPLKPYITALVEHRNDLQLNRTTLEQVAQDRKLSPKYLNIIWASLNAENPSYPMDQVCKLWDENNVDGIVAEVSSWFDRLWEYPKIGSYVNSHRQKPKDPAIDVSQKITLKLEPKPGETEVTLFLQGQSLDGPAATVRFGNPRFVNSNGMTLMLRNYQNYGSQYEVNYAEIFAETESYLTAAVELANNASLTQDQVAAKQKIHPLWLAQWINLLDVKPMHPNALPVEPGRKVPPVKLHLLTDLITNTEHKSINGWSPQAADLPVVQSNASDSTEHVPGRMSPHVVAMHPTPTEFVSAVWKSPIKGRVRVSGKVADAHANCGNGVRWWVELQTAKRSAILTEAAVELGKESTLIAQEINVQPGDRIMLSVAARDANHVCDLTETSFTITEIESKQTRVWDLASDVADNIAAENPHSDRLGNQAVWSFVRGISKDRPPASATDLHGNNLLGRWRKSAATPNGQSNATNYAKQLQALLTGQHQGQDNEPNQRLYKELVSLNGPLLRDIDLAEITKFSRDRNSRPKTKAPRFGLPAKMFEGDDMLLAADKVIAIRLPAALFRDHQFVVDCNLIETTSPSAVQFKITTTEQQGKFEMDASAPIIMSSDSTARQKFLDGLAAFRDVFPPNICYPHIIPLDEVVCLKTFHREDQPLIDLFLTDEQTSELDRLWREHRFITKFPVVENEYLPLFIGFVTQDQPKTLLELFEGKRPEFQQRADAFEAEFNEASVKQLRQLQEFASHAYRRPLLESEEKGLEALYQSLRDKGVGHEEAFRSLIVRVFMSPSFLLHISTAEPTLPATESEQKISPLDNWALASRLSYFLWSSTPDEELRQLANAGKLNQPEVLAAQVQRMLSDDRARSLAIEFGSQWIHVRGFDSFNEKNETLFPTFNAALRMDMYEEAIQFFEHLFRNNASIDDILNADYTFLNEQLANHYVIPGVAGSHFRRVNGVGEFGRGGILGFAAVQSKQAGASRTSPVLRGNWVVETLLGEELPLPPPNVPQLPEQEADNNGLTMRQVTERHTKDKACSICHRRIDPFGYSLEHYDAIGRLRQADSAGRPIDALAKIRDGSQFTGIDGLRDYLAVQKRDVFVRLFCQRLLGYALGRSTTISDQLLIDDMGKKLETGGVADAVLLIVQSKQFLNVANQTGDLK
ncbi:MAG: hypothetical protein COA78_23860 [Blastopirellula sp.]|nr:MAG: hypothetical protein COA78_23860 [Blastopirellula sp.]